VVQELKRKGFEIVGYEDGACEWPLGLRCLALLTGASTVLDSGSTDFSRELGETVRRLLRVEATKQDEERTLRHLMATHGVVGESRTMLAVFRSVLRLSALSDLPVLITGETGTGKQLVAEAIHRLDPKRREGPFVAVNCGAISPSLAEAELFGHRRGAYTGADRDRKGLIRSAQGGVLFLDEIGELTEHLQAKLLRVLQEDRVLGVGEDQEVAIDVRVVAATNRNLPEMVEQKAFRLDLFHRLNILSIHLPPLRERPEDLRPLIDHFLEKYGAVISGKGRSVDRDFVEALTRIPLPGNVRQLENLIRRALVEKDDEAPLGLRDLPPDVWQQISEHANRETGHPVSGQEEQRGPEEDAPSYFIKLLHANSGNLSRSLRQCERSLLQAALRMAHGNQAETARILGVTPRSIYNKIRKHDLHP
jgi:transcriptional regulator with PAS, ATPase and Fis domain